jgi:hypothetical protein
VIAVSREKVTSIETFRKLLRRCMVGVGNCTFQIQRGEEIIEIPIPVKN